MVLGAAEFKTGDTTVYEGQLVKIVSSQSDFIVIEDESGNRSSVRKDALKSTPLFNFYSDEAIKERKERIADFQDKAEEAGKQKKDWLAKIKDLWTKMSGYDKSDEEYKLLKGEYWAARFTKTKYSNLEYSYLMDAYLTASSIS